MSLFAHLTNFSEVMTFSVQK